MDTRHARDLPAQLEELRRRFEQVRQTRRYRSPLPDALWAAAVRMAQKYGIHRTARALRVDYYSLKKRVGQTSAAGSGRPAPTHGRRGQSHFCGLLPQKSGQSPPTTPRRRPSGARAAPSSTPKGIVPATFLELASSVQVGPGECTLELEDTAGAKMRVHLKGFAAPDLAALSRSFWNPGS